MEIPVGKGFVTTIDDEDYPLISQYNWRTITYRSGYTYVITSFRINRKNIIIKMHRLIMNAPKGTQIDHINHDTLNNKKENLRLCNNLQNSQNRKKIKNKKIGKYKGVIAAGNSWKAQITINYKKKYIGTYTLEEDAAHAYNLIALKYNEEFALLNELPDWYDTNLIPKQATTRKYGNNKYVHYEPRRNTWFAAVTVNGKKIISKYFKTEQEAIEARKELLEKYNKEICAGA